MKLDLGEDVAYEISYRGQVYTLSEPTLKQIEAFRAGGAENLLEFLCELGLPKDVAESMPMSKVERLVTGITDSLTKKK